MAAVAAAVTFSLQHFRKDVDTVLRCRRVEVVVWSGVMSVLTLFVFVCVAGPGAWWKVPWPSLGLSLWTLGLFLGSMVLLVAGFLKSMQIARSPVSVRDGLVLPLRTVAETIDKTLHRLRTHQDRPPGPIHAKNQATIMQIVALGMMTCVAAHRAVLAYFRFSGAEEATYPLRLCPIDVVTPEHAFCWDARSLVVGIWGGVLGLRVWWVLVVSEATTLQFASVVQRRWFQMKNRLPCIAYDAMNQAATTLLVFSVAYSLLGSLFLRPCLAWIGGQIPTSLESLANVGLVLQLYLSGCFFFVCVFISQGIMEVIMTEPLYVTERMGHGPWMKWMGSYLDDMEVNALVTAGLAEDKDLLLKYHAFQELHRLSFFSPARRALIYGDRTGAMWDSLVRNCIAPLDALTRTLLMATHEAVEKPSGRLASFLQPSSPQTTRVLFADCQLYMWSVEALAHLTALSSTEDDVGIVQKTLPQVLNCFLGLLLSLDEFASSPAFADVSLIRRLKGNQITRPQLRAMESVLRAGIYEITTTFYEHPSFFSFPPHYAQKLQGFLDFLE